jgi:hypothetical protein
LSRKRHLTHLNCIVRLNTIMPSPALTTSCNTAVARPSREG